MEFKKAQKNLKGDMIGLFILELIILVLSIIIKEFNFFTIIIAALLFLGYIFAKMGTKTAGIIGIFIGIMMMLTILAGDIIDCLLGVYVLIHSLKYNKLINLK